MFFGPLVAYCSEKSVPKPWQTFFAYADRKDRSPFVGMLLGINAHINGDLAVCLTKLEYHERKDFLAINKILEEVLPETLKFLAFHEKDPIALGGLALESFVTQEFKQIVVRWRELAWQNAQIMEASSRVGPEKSLADLHNQAEGVGKQIIKIFDEALHLKHLPRLLERTHELQVGI